MRTQVEEEVREAVTRWLAEDAHLRAQNQCDRAALRVIQERLGTSAERLTDMTEIVRLAHGIADLSTALSVRDDLGAKVCHREHVSDSIAQHNASEPGPSVSEVGAALR